MGQVILHCQLADERRKQVEKCSKVAEGWDEAQSWWLPLFVHCCFPTPSWWPGQKAFRGITCVSTPSPPTHPILNHTSSPPRTAVLSHLFSFPADVLDHTFSASYTELLLGPVCSLGTFSYPSTAVLAAAYCDVTHYMCGVHVCISHTIHWAPWSIEASPGSQSWPRVLLYRCSVNAGEMDEWVKKWLFGTVFPAHRFPHTSIYSLSWLAWHKYNHQPCFTDKETNRAKA